MKEGSLDNSGWFEIFCYTPQLNDQEEKANLVKKQPFVPFANVNKETIESDFDHSHLENQYEGMQLEARKQICNFVW